jgi:sugar O-acyltransferase (sialic acid O-acetyltransferase NeuD family)
MTPVPAGKSRRLIIFGLEDLADLAFEYFSGDSHYEVVGFTVDGAYRSVEEKFGLPVVPFESVETAFPPESCDMFAAIVYGKLNRVRAEVCERIKAKGYKLASYISSHSFVWRNVKLGEHCFVFEDNTIQPFVTIGDNVILWSGNHIGHHSRIGNHCFITSHVVVSGWCEIGAYSFLGVNATLANNTRIGEGCWISHGATLSGDVPGGSLVKSTSSECVPLNEALLFRSLERASRRRR